MSHLSGSSAVCRCLWRPLIESISPPAPPSGSPDEASCLGFAQQGCDLMPAPFLAPAECSGSKVEREKKLTFEAVCVEGLSFHFIQYKYCSVGWCWVWNLNTSLSITGQMKHLAYLFDQTVSDLNLHISSFGQIYFPGDIRYSRAGFFIQYKRDAL